jgi:hypothetical protein
MKKNTKKKNARPRAKRAAALPPGIKAYRGPVKSHKGWFALPELEASGGCRSLNRSDLEV